MEMDMQKIVADHLENIMQYVIKNQRGQEKSLFYFERKCVKQDFSLFYCRGWHIYGAAV